MFAYRYDPITKKSIGTVRCQLNPVATEREGHDVFLLPANSTFEQPFTPKDGFDIVWNGNSWEFHEQEKVSEPEPYQPTELEQAQEKLWEYKRKLQATDYINQKISDAVNTGDEALAAELREQYKDVFVARADWREQVRFWESEVERLSADK